MDLMLAAFSKLRRSQCFVIVLDYAHLHTTPLDTIPGVWKGFFQ